MIFFRFLTLLTLLGLAVNAVAEERADALSTRATFAGAVNKALPAVVSIFAVRQLDVPVNTPGADPLIQRLYGGQPQQVQQKVQRSLGSGVIVRPEGVVVTNFHVVNGASLVKVALSDSREFTAKVLGGDEKTDLAVVQLQLPTNQRLPFAHFGDATTLRPGDVVLALGNPFNIGQSVTMGVVSAVQRSNASLSPYAQFIQTDAAINPGNSGGALIDSTGAVVGINTAIYTRTGATVGIGFATPANLVQTVINDILRTGAVERPWLGAEGRAINPQLARQVGLPDGTGGIYLESIVPGSPAAQAGLQPADIILALNEQPIADAGELNERLLATPHLLDGATTLTILRGGSRQQVPIHFTTLPKRDASARRVVPGYSPLAGLTLEPLGAALNVELSLPPTTQGIAVVAVPANLPAGVTPLPIQMGDLLLAINRQPISTVQQALDAALQSKRHWEVKIQRAGKLLTLTNNPGNGAAY